MTPKEFSTFSGIPAAWSFAGLAGLDFLSDFEALRVQIGTRPLEWRDRGGFEGFEWLKLKALDGLFVLSFEAAFDRFDAGGSEAVLNHELETLLTAL